MENFKWRIYPQHSPNGWSVSVFVVDEANDIVAFGSSDGAMNIERLSDGSGVMRLGDERVPVLAASSPAQ